jgi:hypothetical protein
LYSAGFGETALAQNVTSTGTQLNNLTHRPMRHRLAPSASSMLETTFAIQPHFEPALDFREELAAVRVGNLWGFIDTEGRFAIAPQFEQAQSFREGLAAVKINGRWGFIDKTGTTTISARFEEVEPFSGSPAIAYERGRQFYIDGRGENQSFGPFREATPFVHGLAAVPLAYVNKSGGIIFEYDRHE